MILRSRTPDGKVTMRRPVYDPASYAVPERTLVALRSMAQRQSFEEATTARDGMLRGYARIEAFRRDGHPCFLYQANGSEHCVEIEVQDGVIGAITPVPPRRAWEIAVERDQQFHQGIIYE